jgi:GPH family glycoside/pentoside/hexuronide:cation symporter
LSAIRADQLVLAYVLAGLSGFGIATAYIVPWAMVPNIIEFDQAETGERREGSYYAFFSFFQKLATGVAVWSMGQALAATGYLNPVQGQPLPTQPDAAVNAIRIFMGPVPAVLLIMSIIFAWRVNITRQSHHDMVEQLKNKS